MQVLETKKLRPTIPEFPKNSCSSSTKKIAYLEDDETHGAYLSNWLGRHDIQCDLFGDTSDFEEAFSTVSYDLILLDWELSNGSSGLEILKLIRDAKGTEIPVVFVSSRNTREAVLTAIKNGADDYMPKPVHRSDLLSRINNLTSRKEIVGTTYQCAPYLIDRKLSHVYVDGKTVSLTPREYKLALTLFTNLGKILSHEHLLNAIGGELTLKPYNEVEYLLHIVKKKLKLKNYPQWHVQKVGDIGFRLETDITATF